MVVVGGPQDPEGHELDRSSREDQHRDKITDMQFSRDRTMVVTSSSDKTAKVLPPPRMCAATYPHASYSMLVPSVRN